MPDSPIFREMTIEDYDAVMTLWRSCEGIGLSEADSRENIRLFLKRNPGGSLVAEKETGEIVAAVLTGNDGRRGYLYHLAVAQSCRRTGIGRALQNKATQTLVDLGIRKCHVFVFRDNIKGHKFWKRCRWQLRNDLAVLSRNLSETLPG